MPFKIKKSGKGYKVFSPKGAKSEKPMSKEKARAQQKAIYANWDGKEDKKSKGNSMKITKEQTNKLLEMVNEVSQDYMGGVDQGWRGQRQSSEVGDQSFDTNVYDDSLEAQIKSTQTKIPDFKPAIPGENIQGSIRDQKTGEDKVLALSTDNPESKLIGTSKGRAFYIGKNAFGKDSVMSATIVNQQPENMSITKESAKKLLAMSVSLLNEYETYTDPNTGITWDDEGNQVSGGFRGGRHNTSGYSRRSAYVPKPTSAPLTPPAEDENAAAQRIANAIAKKKGQLQADQGLINWVLKQRTLGKLGGKAPAAPPIAETMLENEVKTELLETADKLLVQFKEVWKKKSKGWGTAEDEKERDIRKDKGIPTVTRFMPKQHRPKTGEVKKEK